MGFWYPKMIFRSIVDRVAMAIVWALPKWVIKWALVRATAHGTTGQYSGQIVPDLTCMDALKRWAG